MLSQPQGVRGERAHLRNGVSPFKKCLVANFSLSQDKSQGPTKNFCFLCHSGRLISRSRAPWRWGHMHTCCARARARARTHASSLGEILPQGRRRSLAAQFSFFSRGHFWGSHSLVDAFPPLAMGPESLMPPLSSGKFSGRGRVGDSGLCLSQWPPGPSLLQGAHP